MSHVPPDPDEPLISVGAGVEDRLRRLAVPASALRGAMWTGLLHALRCTKHDPPSMAGYLAWGKTVRDLRDKLVPLGWTPNDDYNYSTVVSPDGTMAIAVAAGDINTGLAPTSVDKHRPANRRPKGPATRRVVDRNQMTFADITESFPVARSLPALHTWLLLHFIDVALDEVRLELSLPRVMNDQGHVTSWIERIILEPFSLTMPSTQDENDDNDSLDIPVERR